MTNEQILEQQVEALEKLLQLRKAITEELESKISRLQSEVASLKYPYLGGAGHIHTPWVSPPMYPGAAGAGGWQGQGGISIGGAGLGAVSINCCPDGTPHSYPSQQGTTNPSCSKCGHYMSGTTSTISVGCGGVTGIGGSNMTLTNTATGEVTTIDNTSRNVAGNVFTLSNVAK